MSTRNKKLSGIKELKTLIQEEIENYHEHQIYIRAYIELFNRLKKNETLSDDDFLMIKNFFVNPAEYWSEELGRKAKYTRRHYGTYSL